MYEYTYIYATTMQGIVKLTTITYGELRPRVLGSFTIMVYTQCST